jgi:hypothetical protein
MWNTARAARRDDGLDLGLASHRVGRSRSTRGFMPCQPPRGPRRPAQRRACWQWCQRGHMAVARPRPCCSCASTWEAPRCVRSAATAGSSSTRVRRAETTSCCYRPRADPSLHPRRHLAPRVTRIAAEMTPYVVTRGARSTPGAGVTARELGRAAERVTGALGHSRGEASMASCCYQGGGPCRIKRGVGRDKTGPGQRDCGAAAPRSVGTFFVCVPALCMRSDQNRGRNGAETVTAHARSTGGAGGGRGSRGRARTGRVSGRGR